MADEQVGQVVLATKVQQQVQDLRLDGHVESGDRLIADDELRIEGEGSRDPQALALASGEFVGKRRV